MYIDLLAQKFYDYSSYIRGYTPATIRRYKFVINAFLKFARVTQIEEVTEEHVRTFFYHGRTDRKWQVSTFITFHVSLLVFFRWCVAEKCMSKNWVEDIPIPKLEKKIPSKLTKQDALRLLDIIDNFPSPDKFVRYRNHALVSMFLFAGLRKSELLNLKYIDVDIENLTVFIRQGKGSKDRIIPMSYTLANTLKRYLEERNKRNRTCVQFFTSSHRNAGCDETLIKRLVIQLRSASGIYFNAHKLRHTFATLMLEGGCDIFSLSKMMGHSDIKTTTIYLSASVEHLRNQIFKHPLEQNRKRTHY